MKAFAALDRFDETQAFAPWLKRIAINAAVDSLRRSRRLEFGDASERIYESGVAEAAYEPDPAARTTTTAAAALVRGRVLDEGQVAEAAKAVREALGAGPTVDRRIEGSRRARMPFVALLSILPLAFVLYRRNL